MRLKEIEARLAEIKEELNTRAAELTDEENYKTGNRGNRLTGRAYRFTGSGRET